MKINKYSCASLTPRWREKVLFVLHLLFGLSRDWRKRERAGEFEGEWIELFVT